ncbi:MAG: redox-regulated ATPase YchF [Acidimicrobiales bacterium]
MERFGFVGLPNAGKSSLFNALAGGGALAAPYAFATTDPNVGVARVPDERLQVLSDLSESKKIVPATQQFVDIGGLVEGASQGEGLGNKFLAGIREVDAIVLVLRAFADPDVPGPTDPLEHLAIVETELALADLEAVSSRLEKRRKAARLNKADQDLQLELEALEAADLALSDGVPLFRSDLSDKLRDALKPHFLLTNKPVLAIVNISEDQLDHAAELAQPIADELSVAEVVPISVQLEAEAAELDESDRKEMLEALGLGEGAIGRFVRATHHLMGLRTYLTTGEQETRAWTFRDGYTAPQCAGIIHTDFERGFIRAETIGFDELVGAGSWVAAREKGILRLEGKEYIVQDGDVMEFRFNV